MQIAPLAKPALKVYMARINLSHYGHFDDRVWEWAPPDPLFFIAAALPQNRFRQACGGEIAMTLD